MNLFLIYKSLAHFVAFRGILARLFIVENFSYGSQLGHKTFNAVGKAVKRYYIYTYYIPWVLMLILLVSLARYSSLIG